MILFLSYSCCEMDRGIPTFPVGLEGWTGGKDPDRAGHRELQPGLARRLPFLLPDTQETTLVICRGDLTSNPSSTLYWLGDLKQ